MLDDADMASSSPAATGHLPGAIRLLRERG
jgi:hypothetical protein